MQEWQNHLPWNTDDNRNFSPLGWEEKDLPNPFIGALSDLPTNYYDNQKRQGVDVSVNQDGSASAPGGRMWPHLGEVYYYNNDMNKQLDKVPADKVSDKDIEYYTNPPQDTPSMTPSDESMIRILRMAVPQL